MAWKVNFLELIPVRCREWETLDDERIAVIQPRFFNRFVKRAVEPFLQRSDVRVRLDSEGSFVWNCCDGTNSVYDIGMKFEEKFGSGEDTFSRMQSFFAYLERCEMISYSNLEELKKTENKPIIKGN